MSYKQIPDKRYRPHSRVKRFTRYSHILRQYKKVAIGLCVLAALYVLLHFVLLEFEQQPLHLRYELPMQDANEERTDLMPERVYFSSSINDWAEEDEFYQMEFDGIGTWNLTLELEPGQYAFRFVLHYPPTAPHWTNTKEYVLAGDRPVDSKSYSDGRSRSELLVRNIHSIRRSVEFVFITLLIGIPLFFPIKVALIRFMRLHISLQYKLTVSFLALLIISNFIFLMNSSSQHADFTRTLQRDSINVIHTMLISEGIHFRGIENNPAMQFAIRERLERFFQSSRLRQNYNNFANNFLQITRLSVLDTEGNILVNVLSRSLRDLIQTYYPEEEKLNTYYEQLTQRIFEKYRKLDKANKKFFSFSIFNYFTDEMWRATSSELIRQYQKETAFFKDNGYIVPIRHGDQTLGYYFFEVDGGSYSLFFQSNFLSNLILLAFIILLCFVLMLQIMNIMLAPILSLIEGLGMVRDGNFDYNIQGDTHDEIEELGEAYNFMRKHIQKTQGQLDYYTNHLETELDSRTYELKRKNAIYREELLLARKIQRQMLYSEKPIPADALEYDVSYYPCSEVGGDFYNISRLRPSCIRVFLADVTGHGVPAALITMLLKSEYEKVRFFDDPVTILQKINDSFISAYASLTLFFTGIILDINTENMTLRHVCAGHPYPLLLRNSSCIPLTGRGRMIGVVPDPGLTLEATALEEDDRIILFTDGLFEQTNSQNEEYGIERIKEILLREASSRTCEEINKELQESLRNFMGTQKYIDDVTFVTIHCLKKQQEAKN
jgi:serine phosphatase RsbU (regulator of sigma subunit)